MSGNTGDRMFLQGLAVECIIGFIEWERRVKQTVLIDLELAVDSRRAARSDEVADTVDYAQVAARVTALVQDSDFKLVETLAHRIAMLVIGEFGVPWVRVSLHKPGAIRGAREVGVTIERTRADLETAPSGARPG